MINNQRHIFIKNTGLNPLCKSVNSTLTGYLTCSLYYYSTHRLAIYDHLCQECCNKLPEKVHNRLKHNLIVVKLKP